MHQVMVLAIRIAFIISFFFVAGCAKQHKVFINPYLPIHDSKIGNKIPISLYVEDSRSNNIITKWEKGLRKFSISSQHDLKEIFLTKIKQGLIKLDFNPKIHRKNPNRSLKIQILDISSKYRERIPRMDVRVNAKLRANCRNNDEKYFKTYSAQKIRRSITPATFPNENLLNAVLSEILGKMLTDQTLLDCLTN